MPISSGDDIPFISKLLIYVGCMVSILLWPLLARESAVEVDWREYAEPLQDVVVNPLPENRDRDFSQGNGSCMPYARSRSGLPISGSACTILNRLDDYGLSYREEPAVGTVVVTSEGPCGHVAVVEEIKEKTIVISEQNYKGLYVVSERELAIDSELIQGYVYK